MKYFLSIFVLVLCLGCGGSDDPDPVQENRNPGAFTITTSNISDKGATLNWTSSIDPDGDNITYEVKLNESSIANNITQTTYALSGLNDNTSYNGSVTAKDGNGGATSINYNFTTLEDTNANTINFNIPSELEAYYNDMTFYEDAPLLKDELAAHIIGKHTTFLSYTDRHNYLYNADEDLDNDANVTLIYSGESRDEREYQSGGNSHSPQTFNTEHIYPRSLIGNTAEADLHHLRVCDISINSQRQNYPFTDGEGTYKLINNNSWYPGDEWKGDVARMVMYLNLRYDENFSDVGSLELFLKWNIEDPVSDFEKQRNDIIQTPQGNRNPFIDNPYLATLIWGGENAENRW